MVAFSSYDTFVRVHPSVTSIPPSAFKDRIDLVEVELPEGLQEIGEDAFSGCTLLRKINLVEGLRVIGPRAFQECTSLLRVDIPSTVTAIADGVFWKCTSLLCIDIPTTVTSIGEFAFNGCSSLKEVNLRGGLQEIGSGAFRKCTALLRIDIPSNVSIIGDEAFVQCTSLKEVNLSDGLQEIGTDAFRECTALLCIDIPSTVTSIGEYAFCNCTSLKAVDLRDGIQVLGDWVFGECTSLRRVDIPSTVISIGESTFEYCSSLKEVNLRDGLQEISSYAFARCTSLLRIEIPASAGVIRYEAFKGCRFLRNISISPSSALQQDEDDTDPMFESLREIGCSMDMISARFDDLPIHRLCFYHLHEAHPNTRTLLEALVAQLAGVDVLGMTPLHVLACSGSHDLNLYNYLIGCFPQAMTVKDKWGETPLDYILLSEAPNEVIQFFLRSHSERSNIAPFDVDKTIQRCKSGVFLKNLVKAQRTFFPEFVIDWQSIADESVHRNVPLGVYGVIVEASISSCFNRMSYEHQLEVDNTIDSIIDSGKHIAPEQYADIRMLITKYTHHFQEVASAIELAVWKTKFYELFVEKNGNEHHKIRSNSYIQSGTVCAVVIPLVLTFL